MVTPPNPPPPLPPRKFVQSVPLKLEQLPYHPRLGNKGMKHLPTLEQFLIAIVAEASKLIITDLDKKDLFKQSQLDTIILESDDPIKSAIWKEDDDKEGEDWNALRSTQNPTEASWAYVKQYLLTDPPQQRPEVSDCQLTHEWPVADADSTEEVSKDKPETLPRGYTLQSDYIFFSSSSA